MRILARGFTLIEILVVIAIIGILAAVIYASFGEARIQAQNKALSSELKEVQLALEVYRAQNGQYPAVPGFGAPCDDTTGTTHVSFGSGCGSNAYITGLVPEFIAELPLPEDAANSSCQIEYSVDGTDYSWYKLTAVQCYGGAAAAANGIQPDSEFARCPSTCSTCAGSTYGTYISSAPFYESMAVYSAGGECI